MTKGILYVIGIPIGNFFDLSNRAIFVLKNVDFILAEDSRKICFILSFLNFKNKVISISNNNESYVCNFLIKKLNTGQSAAIVSDAGTPGISDPGNFFVKSIYANGLKVIPIPGASIISTVISVSSFAVNRFVFDGFLPKKALYKKIYFKKILHEERVCIFFESADRLLETLLLIKSIFSLNRLIFIAKDLTKKFEFIMFFKLCDLNLDMFDFNNQFSKGEFVILLSGFEYQLFNINTITEHILLDLVVKNDFYKFVFYSAIFNKNKFIFYFFDFMKK